MSKKPRPLTIPEIHSHRIRERWREQILKLAAAVQDGKTGIEALWAIDEARSLFEQALQWHAYNRAAKDLDKKHRAIPEDRP